VVGASEESAPGAISLAEVSSRYKAEKGTRNAKVLSNEDVQAMLNNKSGVTMAKNMPPLGSGALEQGAQAQSTGSQPAAQSAQANQQNAATKSSTNQPAQAASSQAGTPAPAANSQSPDNGVSAENSTTPQINQKQQSNDAQGSRRLPATATFLPLLGLLGLVSGGIGLWFRKFRN
jgi:cobalamin biosynthesis Mg chelatase CobN